MPDRLPRFFYRWMRAVRGCGKSLFTPRCGCPRCVDPTEFGTNTSGLPCGSCQGLLLPQVTPTEREYRVSSGGGAHFLWMSPPVRYNKRFLLAIFVIYSVEEKGRGESVFTSETDTRLFLAKHCKQKYHHQNRRNSIILMLYENSYSLSDTTFSLFKTTGCFFTRFLIRYQKTAIVNHGNWPENRKNNKFCVFIVWNGSSSHPSLLADIVKLSTCNILNPWYRRRRRRRRAGSVGAAAGRSAHQRSQPGQSLMGLSHERYFKTVDKHLQNLALLRDAAGFWNFWGASVISQCKKFIYSG